MSDNKVTSNTFNQRLSDKETNENGSLGERAVSQTFKEYGERFKKYVIEIHTPIFIEDREVVEENNFLNYIGDYLATINSISAISFGLIAGATISKPQRDELATAFVSKVATRLLLSIYAGYMLPNILARHGEGLINTLAYVLNLLTQLHAPIDFENRNEEENTSFKPNFVGAVLGLLVVGYMGHKKHLDKETTKYLSGKIIVAIMGAYGGFIFPNGLNILRTLYAVELE